MNSYRHTRHPVHYALLFDDLYDRRRDAVETYYWELTSDVRVDSRKRTGGPRHRNLSITPRAIRMPMPTSRISTFVFRAMTSCL